jgi:hypothetical protein
MFLSVLSKRATKWVNDNLIIESWQVNGNTIAVDKRYFDDIYSGLTDAGLVPQIDFNVF